MLATATKHKTEQDITLSYAVVTGTDHSSSSGKTAVAKMLKAKSKTLRTISQKWSGNVAAQLSDHSTTTAPNATAAKSQNRNQCVMP